MSDLEKEEKKKEELIGEIMPQSTFNFDKSFSIVLAGSSRTGKSCLMKKAISNYFEEDYSSTHIFDYLTAYIKINGNIIKLNISDTSGKEIYKSYVISSYEKSSLAIFLYSIDDKESFVYIKDLYNEIKSKTNIKSRIILVGNKSDLEKERKISQSQAIKLRNENGFDLFMETSAKTGYNANNVLIEAAKILYSDYSTDFKKNK